MQSTLKRMLVAAALLVSTQVALAADPVKFGLCYDLTKIYVAAVPQLGQAVKDYADLLNARGGLEGHPIEVTVQDHGNTSAASVPMALDVAVRDGRIKRGDMLLLEAFGGGFTWGSALIRY